MTEQPEASVSQPAPPAEVPVADQLAAGVPSEATVTLADQRAGEAVAPVVVTPSGDLAPDPDVVPDGGAGVAESGGGTAAGEAEEVAAPVDVPETGPGLDTPPEPGTVAMHPGVSNASVILPASAAAAAARAHVALGKVIEHLQASDHVDGAVVRVIEAIRTDIERYVPAPLLHAAEGEGLSLVASVL